MIADLKDVPENSLSSKKPKNVFVVTGEKRKLVKRSVSANAFHTIAYIRSSKVNGVKKHKINWLVIFLCLLAGLVIGAELYFYLSKGVLLTK